MNHAPRPDKRPWFIGLLVLLLLAGGVASLIPGVVRHLRNGLRQEQKDLVRIELNMGDRAQAEGGYEAALGSYRLALARNGLIPDEDREVTNATIQSSILDTLVRLERFIEAEQELAELERFGGMPEEVLRPARTEVLLHLGRWQEAVPNAIVANHLRPVTEVRTAQELAIVLALSRGIRDQPQLPVASTSPPLHRYAMTLHQAELAQRAGDTTGGYALLRSGEPALDDLRARKNSGQGGFDMIRSAWLLELAVHEMRKGTEGDVSVILDRHLRMLRELGDRPQ